MRRRSWIISLASAGVLAAVVLGRQPDQQLHVTAATIAQLQALREEPEFLDLPGEPAARERARFEPKFNALLDRLIGGVWEHPSRDWVIGQMDPLVDEFHLEDTELRERCFGYIDRIFKILGIPDSGGAFRKYLILEQK